MSFSFTFFLYILVVLSLSLVPSASTYDVHTMQNAWRPVWHTLPFRVGVNVLMKDFRFFRFSVAFVAIRFDRIWIYRKWMNGISSVSAKNWKRIVILLLNRNGQLLSLIPSDSLGIEIICCLQSSYRRSNLPHLLVRLERDFIFRSRRKRANWSYCLVRHMNFGW